METGTRMMRTVLLAVLVLAGSLAAVVARPGFSYAVAGNPADVAADPGGGVALMGGGPDQDAAFAWMAERAGGGDFLVLRVSGTAAYNRYVRDLGVPLDSVATLIVRERSAASHPDVVREIEEAEAIFLAGGDQAAYLDLWRGTPLAKALQERIDAGAVVGGTSAGAMLLSGHVYSARRGTVTSRDALHDPFNRRVTLSGAFVNVPLLADIVVDTHFSERNRPGRLLVFLARLAGDGGARGIGLDEGTALLVEPDGAADVVGEGRVLLVEPHSPPQRLRRDRPLAWSDVPAVWAAAGNSFDLDAESGAGADSVLLSANRGRLVERPAP